MFVADSTLADILKTSCCLHWERKLQVSIIIIIQSGVWSFFSVQQNK